MEMEMLSLSGTEERLWSAAVPDPAVALGAVAGSRIHIQLSEAKFKSIVSLVLVLLGILLLFRSLF